jgi:hypothetical protein
LDLPSSQLIKNSTIIYMSNQSFAHLFRKSKFARLQHKLPHILSSSKADPNMINGILPKESPQIDYEARGTFFGTKMEIPQRYYGGQPEYIRIKQPIDDGPLGQPAIEDAKLDVLRQQALRLLFLILGSASISPRVRIFDEGTKNSWLALYGTRYESLLPPGTLVKVPGKLVQQVPGGYGVDVAGFDAFLPVTEIPGSIQFTYGDLSSQRVFDFYVRRLELYPQPKILLTLRATGSVN